MIPDKNKTKVQLFEELNMLRKRVRELEIQISEQRSAEQITDDNPNSILNLSPQDLHFLFNSLNDFLFILDSEGRILHVNPVVERRLGYSLENLVGGIVLKVHPPDRREEAGTIITDILDGKASVCPIPLMTKNGTLIQVETNFIPGKWGGKEALFGISRDITERVQVEDSLSESEARWRSLTETSPDHILTLDTDLNIQFANFASPGLTVKELIGTPLYTYVGKEKQFEIKAILEGVLRTGEPATYDTVYHIPDGSIIHYESRVVPRKLQDSNEIIGLTISARDITDRVQAEEKLRESEEKFRSLAEQSPNMIFVNKKGRVVYANKKCEEIMGYKREEFYSPVFDFLTLIAPEYRNLIKVNFSKHIKGEDVPPYEYTLITKEGEKIDVINAPKLIRYGGEIAILGIVTDITERKRAEEALRESEATLRSIFRVAPTGIGMVKNRVIHQVNDRFCEIIGYSREELLGKDARITYPSDEEYEWIGGEKYRQIQEKGTGTVETKLKRKNGDIIDVLLSSTPIDTDNFEAGITFTALDITERKRSDEALRKNEERYRLLVENASDAIFLLDMNTRFIDVNQATCDSLGCSHDELLNMSAADINMEWSHNKLSDFLKDLVPGESVTIEGIHQRKNKTKFPVEICVTLIETEDRQVVLAIARDITQRRRIEESLRESKIKEMSTLETVVTTKENIRVSGINIAWKPGNGVCTFEGLPVAMMWIDTTLAGLMAGVQSMVGTERFALALQSEGRKSVEADWQVISQFPDFQHGFKAIANIAAVAGWGNWNLISLDEKKKECRFHVWNSWEGLYQKALGVCWGSAMLAGKLAGYCSMIFKTNCWADQTSFITKGNEFDEFVVHPSKRSIEQEIENLLVTDEATRADMAVALQKLQSEIRERQRAEEEVRKFNIELEHRVMERTMELETANQKLATANRELEAFSYSVSHDLRAPLRHIDGFSLALLEDYYDKLDEDGRNYLERVRNGTQRMSELIDDMLKLFRITRQTLKIQKVNLTVAVSRIIEELKTMEPDRNIESKVAENLTANCDVNMIHIALKNLLKNAVKYTSREKMARIEFGTKEIEGERIFYVKDNGVGFNMKYKNKLFTAFQRLHGADEFKGSGVGLSIVQRIIARHKGRIWAEGEEGKGATFYFTLGTLKNNN